MKWLILMCCDATDLCLEWVLAKSSVYMRHAIEEWMVLMCCDSSRSWPVYIGSLMRVPYDFGRFASVNADLVQSLILLGIGGAFRRIERAP